MLLHQTRFCFVCTHLTSAQKKRWWAEEKLGCHRDTQEDKGFLALRPQKTTSPLRISFSISKTNDPYFKKHCFLYLPVSWLDPFHHIFFYQPCNMAWRSKLPDSTVLPICQSPMQNWRALLANYQIRLYIVVWTKSIKFLISRRMFTCS